MEKYDLILLNLLNLHPDDVKEISTVKAPDGSVTFIATLTNNDTYCPYCNGDRLESIGYYRKTIKVSSDALDNCTVILRVQRKICLICRKSFSDSKVLTPDKNKYSYSIIRQLLRLLLNPAMTFSQASILTGIPYNTVLRLFDKHVHVKPVNFPDVICIDEVYTPNSSYDSKFSCLFYDFLEYRLIDVLPSRKKAFIANYLTIFPVTMRDNVKYVSIDMYQPYKDICRIYFKKAIVCADHFHVLKHLNDDLNDVRIRISKKYDPASQEYYLLKRWKNLLFDRTVNLDNKGKFNRKFQRVMNYRDILDAILSIDIDLYNAYHLKERYFFFDKKKKDDPDLSSTLDELIRDFTLSNIPEFEEFTTLLTNWRKEILNSFNIMSNGKRINSSVAESMNASVEIVLYTSKGIRNHERRRKRILYSINKERFSL